MARRCGADGCYNSVGSTTPPARGAAAAASRSAANELGAKYYFMQSHPPPRRSTRACLTHVRRELAGLIKQNATYWLGLVMYEQGEYEVSEDWLLEHTLKAWPDGLWTNGAHFNLAQAYESAGQPDKAIQQYLADEGPQRHGDQLRARWLRHRPTTKPDVK